MSLKFIKPERILLSSHPELREKWVRERIAEDPSILGLGDLVLKDRQLAAAGIDVMDYDNRGGGYRLRVTKSDIKQHSELLVALLKMAAGLEVELPVAPK